MVPRELIVAVDTCGPVIGVGARCGDAVATRALRLARGAETKLAPWLVAIAAELGVDLSRTAAVAVAHGPGAFTGLRVGVATALGLAMAAGCPVVPIGSLDARAHRQTGPALAILDARKGRAYARWYVDGRPTGEPVDAAIDAVLAGAPRPFVAVGEGALVWSEAITFAGGRIAPDADAPPLAVLLDLGLVALREGGGVRPEAVRPFYLRAPDARAPGPPPGDTGDGGGR